MLLIFKDVNNYLQSVVVFLSCRHVQHPSSGKDSRSASGGGMTDNYRNRVGYE
jgi:hypothetical protein